MQYEFEVEATVRVTRKVRLELAGDGELQVGAQEAERRVQEELQAFSPIGAEVTATASRAYKVAEGAREQPDIARPQPPLPPAAQVPAPPPPPAPAPAQDPLAAHVLRVDKNRYLALEALAKAAEEFCLRGNASGIRGAWEALTQVQVVLPVPQAAA